VSVKTSYRKDLVTVDGSTVQTRIERAPDNAARAVIQSGDHVVTMSRRDARALARRLLALADRLAT
jgi:hypothetical protein